MTTTTKEEEARKGDVEQALPTPKPRRGKVKVITDLEAYEGLSYAEKVDSFVQKHPIVMVNRSGCLFSTDALDFLVQLGVTVYSLEVDTHPQGTSILKHLTKKWNHKTTPMIFISGKLPPVSFSASAWRWG